MVSRTPHPGWIPMPTPSHGRQRPAQEPGSGSYCQTCPRNDPARMSYLRLYENFRGVLGTLHRLARAGTRTVVPYVGPRPQGPCVVAGADTGSQPSVDGRPHRATLRARPHRDTRPPLPRHGARAAWRAARLQAASHLARGEPCPRPRRLTGTPERRHAGRRRRPGVVARISIYRSIACRYIARATIGGARVGRVQRCARGWARS